MEIAGANAALQEEVTVRQQAEAEAAFANQAKSDFLASMSHEIRTPLNAILGYAQLMQRDAHLSAEQRDGLEGINAGGQHLLGLINEILDLSKIEAGRMELNPVTFSLGGLLRGLEFTFKPLCARKGIAFRVEADGLRAKTLRGDEGKLRQVLINLLGNAVKFTGAGEVRLRCGTEQTASWQFEVMDTGLGIPAEEQADIFKPFHQGTGAQHQGGTGLGLTIAQRQVALLGGELKLQSERGIGSRFHFSIPLAPAQGEIEVPGQEVIRLAAGITVLALVVDDRRENREVLGRMLSRIGCEVLLAADGEEALSIARARSPAIVFLDLLLPGLDGAATARALLAEPKTAQCKIVAHTASALERHRDDALAAGCVDFVAKPFRCERIYECLGTHLGVTFEYAETPAVAETPPSLDGVQISLPEELCARLAVAAELHSTTALKAALQELRGLGPEASLLAEHIRHLMRSYDMNGIQRLLAQVALPVTAS
jgi:CheY-like chemotaxis protein